MKGRSTLAQHHLPLSLAPPPEPRPSGDPPMKDLSAPAEHHLPLSMAPPLETIRGT